MASSSLPVYDVVLSSSSKDAVDFSYLLCKSLTSQGIRVLRGEDGQDDVGDTTTTSQELAIKESIRFAIVILSRNYASSPRLLDELSQILERERVSGIRVLPVFYDVEPSDVRYQKGVFGESFNKNVQVFKEDPEKVLRWRIALREVANLSGWSSEHRNQIEIIQEIVNYVVGTREQRGTLTKSTDDNSVNILPSSLRVLEYSSSMLISDVFPPTTRGFENIRELCLHGMWGNISLLGLRNLTLHGFWGIRGIRSLSQCKVFKALPRKKWESLDLPHGSLDFPYCCQPRTVDIIEQPGDADISNISVGGEIRIADNEDREGITDVMLIGVINPEDREGTPDVMLIDINAHEDREGTTDATSSAQWNFLLTALVLEIFSASFDQASSPSNPHYALIGMLLAIAAVLACTWELICKGSLVLKRWQKLRWFYYLHPSNTLFGSLPDIFGLVSSISQCVFSTVQYIYFSHHVDSPIKLSLLPAIYLICLAGSKLHRNQRCINKTS